MFEWLAHVELLDVSWVVASDVVSALDEVWSIDWLFTETKVRSSDTAGLVSIVSEVSLTVEWSVVDDELDGLLVSTNSTIGTETPEDALLGGFWKVISWGTTFKSGFWSSNTNSEVVAWFFSKEVLGDSSNVLWSEVFRTDTITTANSDEVAFAVETSNDIVEEWFVSSGNFVNLVKNADALDGSWDDLVDHFGWEWAEHVDLEDTNLGLWVGLDVFFNSIAARAHEDDASFILLGTNVLNWFVVTASEFAILVHHILEDAW